MLEKKWDDLPKEIVGLIVSFLGAENPDDLIAFKLTCKKNYQIFKDDNFIKQSPFLSKLDDHLKERKKLLKKLARNTQKLKEHCKIINEPEKTKLEEYKNHLERICRNLMESKAVSVDNDVLALVKDIRNKPDASYFKLSNKSKIAHVSTAILTAFMLLSIYYIVVFDKRLKFLTDRVNDPNLFYDYVQEHESVKNGLAGWSIALCIVAVVEFFKHCYFRKQYIQDWQQSREVKKYLECPVRELTFSHSRRLTYYKSHYPAAFENKKLETIADGVRCLMKVYYMTLSKPSTVYLEGQKLLKIVCELLKEPGENYQFNVKKNLSRPQLHQNINNFFSVAKEWDQKSDDQLTLQKDDVIMMMEY